jgi:integrase
VPRAGKGARLWLRPASPGRTAVWIIRNGDTRISTGCGPENRGEAEKRLAEYLSEKYRPERKHSRHASSIPVADVLSIYAEDIAPRHSRPHETAARVGRLLSFFGDKMLSDITGPSCRAYVAHRKATASARQELEDLRAAVLHHRREGLCDQVVDVRLPEKSPPRERWLSRSEAARLLWTARRNRYIAHFILVGLYTGTRSGAILGASLKAVSGKGYVDLDKGVFYRKAFGARATKKRQPPIPIPPKLLSHIRRWKRREYLIEWKGQPVTTVGKAFRQIAREAGLADVTPHTLRHTCATWLVENGAETSDVAKYLGMSEAMVEGRYGHIGNRSLARAVEAISRR